MSPSIILQRPGADWARHHPDTDKTAGRLGPGKKNGNRPQKTQSSVKQDNNK